MPQSSTLSIELDVHKELMAVAYVAQEHPAPLQWFSEVLWPPTAPHIVFQAYGRTVHEHTEHLQRLAQTRNEPVQTWRLPSVVVTLQALRGGQCPVAVPPVAALGDLPRCNTPRQRMDSLDLPPRKPPGGRGAGRAL